jgi:hypothetical protein
MEGKITLHWSYSIGIGSMSVRILGVLFFMEPLQITFS